jgi:hypothetical protein
LYAFSLKSGRPFVRKFLAIHGACCIEFSNISNLSLFFDAFTICSESMNPIVPSDGYAARTVGPPASLTRSSVPGW